MSEERSNTYMTLPSNVAKTFYADNTISSYRTKLSMDMNLEGTWEVGLTELHYPRTWKVLKTAGWITILIYRLDNKGSIKGVAEDLSNTSQQYIIPLKAGKTPEENHAAEVVIMGDITDDGTFESVVNAGKQRVEVHPTYDVIHIEVPAGNYHDIESVCKYITRAAHSLFPSLKPFRNNQLS